METAEQGVVSRDRVVEAFVSWAAEKGKEIAAEQSAFISDALEELIELRPGLVMNWYLSNQYRYEKMTELHRREARLILISFLTDVQMGRLAL